MLKKAKPAVFAAGCVLVMWRRERCACVGEEGRGIPHLCQDNSAKTLRHVFAGDGWHRRYVDMPAL